MNLSPVVTASSAPPPAEASRSGEPAHTEDFSNVLSQQQGQVRERGAATTQAAAKPARPVAEPDTPVPDETLALLAAGATLPLMMTRAELTSAANGISAQEIRAGRGGGAALTAATNALHASADTAKSILAEAQALVSTATAPRGKAADMSPTPPALIRAVESTVLTSADLRNVQTSSTRPHIALTSAAPGAGQLAARAGSNTKPDAAQAALTQIASAIGLNTQPVTTAATSAIDSRSIQDAANAMAGTTALAQGSSTTLLTTQPSGPIVATPLANPAWAADFSRQFVSMTQGRDMSQPHTIELRLDPPSLGPVRITMHISDSIAQATFVSPHAVVRQAIENALPQLQQQLAQAGLSLGQASVNDQPGSQQGFEQSSSQGSRNQSVFSLDGSSSASDAGALLSAPRQTPRSPDALVDTFA